MSGIPSVNKLGVIMIGQAIVGAVNKVGDDYIINIFNSFWLPVEDIVHLVYAVSNYVEVEREKSRTGEGFHPTKI